jgi:hypothetical protein
MQTFTFGTTPESVIRAAFERETPDGYYIDAQGIDPATMDVIGYGSDSGIYDADQLITLLDELYDFPADLPPHDRYGDLRENAWSLRASILETLGIEEI